MPPFVGAVVGAWFTPEVWSPAGTITLNSRFQVGIGFKAMYINLLPRI